MMTQHNIGNLFCTRIEQGQQDQAIGWIEKGKIVSLSYEQYGSIVKSIAASLEHLGFRKGIKACILGLTCKEWHFADMANLCFGVATVPIYPNYLSDEIRYIICHSECELLYVEDETQLKKFIQIQQADHQVKTIISFKKISSETRSQLDSEVGLYEWEDFLKLGKPDFDFKAKTEEVSGNDIATIIYTSGTTGEPKGAVILQESFHSLLVSCKEQFNRAFNSSDTTLTFLPLSHVFGRVESFLPLAFGWKLVFAESLERIIENIPIVRPTIMLAVPRIFEKIYSRVMTQIEQSSAVKRSLFDWALRVSNKYFDKLDRSETPSLGEKLQRELAYKLVFSKIYQRFGGRVRYFVSGGAPLSADIMKFLRNANLVILEGYGLTETIGPCCINPADKQVPGTIGLPFPGTEFQLASDGELMIKTKAMLTEYYKNPEETKKALQNGWFYSGDIAEWDETGYLKITDRKKEIIVTSGGKNVAPQKIENKMKTMKHIANFAVIGDQRKYLTAVVGIEKEAFFDSKLDLDEKADLAVYAAHPEVFKLIKSDIDKVNQDLASFESIKKFYVSPIEFSVENGLVTPSLKLKRKILKEKFKNQIDAMYQ